MKITERFKLWWLFTSYDLKKYHQWFTDPIYYFFNPQQGWLMKHLRKTWMDKDELIETCLFQSLVHWVEVEDDREIDWAKELADGNVSQDYVDRQLKFDSEIDECYKWIKVGRKAAMLELDAVWPSDYPFWDSPISSPDLQAMKDKTSQYVAKHTRLEKKIERKDTAVMKKIVELRGSMWT